MLVNVSNHVLAIGGGAGGAAAAGVLFLGGSAGGEAESDDNGGEQEGQRFHVAICLDRRCGKGEREFGARDL